MTSYTKQLRTSKGVIAALSRENIDQAPAPVADEMTPEAATAVLAEPVAQEIEQDVLAPAEQIEQGTDALMEAEADAGLLENTAQILEDASGETAADVDVATPELANITVERISAKYGMARTAVLSKESLGAAASRVETTRFISKEAFEKAGELRKRVSEGLKKLIEWFKNLIKNIFDKRTKLEKRCEAIVSLSNQKIKEKAVAEPNSMIALEGQRFMRNGKIAEKLDDLVDGMEWHALMHGFKIASSISKNILDGEVLEDSEFVMNKTNLGGASIVLTISDGAIRLTKSSVDTAPYTEVPVLTPEQTKSCAMWSRVVLKELRDNEKQFSSLSSNLEQAWKAQEKSAKDGDGQEDSHRTHLSNLNAVVGAVNALSAVVLMVITGVLHVLEKSLDAHQAPANAT